MTDQAAGGESLPEVERPSDARAEAVAAAVDSWTRHLVDLGGRNTLLWYRDLPTGTLDLSTAHPSGLASLMSGRPTRLSELVREPAAFEEARRRARAIAAKARELKEERGIETCFVTFGMATWDLGAGTRAPAAPVLLRACVLRPVSPAHDDYLLDLADHVELNPVLEHYLQKERGLVVDSDGLEALATAGSGFDAHPVFAGLAESCLGVPGFAITPRIVVGTFSYAKLPMVADLRGQGELLVGHDVVAALAGDPGALAAVRSEIPGLRKDPLFDEQGATLLLDADGSQHEVIEAVRSGSHLVIQGPPGTGKSQTIANLIGSLAADGKKVLFVAEKRAAIEAVVSRLDSTGLGSLVLDLHDGARAKRRVAQEFLTGLEEAEKTSTSVPRDAAEVRRRQHDTAVELEGHRAALHDLRQPWGVSAHQAMEAVSRLGRLEDPPRSKIRLRGQPLSLLTATSRENVVNELSRLADMRAWRPEGGEDPWFGANISTPEDAVSARDRVERLAHGSVAALEATLAEVLGDLRLPPAHSVADWGVTLETLAAVRQTLEDFRPEIFDTPLDEAVIAAAPRAVREGSPIELGWWERWQIRRATRRFLRPGKPPTDLYAALVAAAGQRSAWRQLAGAGGRPDIPADLDRARRAHAAVVDDLTWLQARLPEGAPKDLVGMDRAELDLFVQRLQLHRERLAVLPAVRGPLEALRASGWGPLIDDFAGRGVDAPQVRSEVEHVWWTSVVEELALRDPRIGGHVGDHLRSVLDRFTEADRAVLADNARRLLEDVRERVRTLVRERPEHAAILRAEGGRRRGLRSLRDLLPMAPELMTSVKPCWVMSPLVVASVLPAGRWFDVVIFDEASQVPPAEAVSAISRARQVVLAGDAQQLPPTTFFTTAPDDEAASLVGLSDREAGPSDLPQALTEGMESILDVLSAALPMRRLRWHYRSLDERLIAFSNRHFYEGRLISFPGTGTDPVLSLETVEGHGVVDLEAAAVESTRSEVARVVALVLEHARSRPEESLGVITLGLVHANRVQEGVRKAVAELEDAQVRAFFDEERRERFFVKNLERVQGDERDAIIVSIGYGKTPHGRVLHRFGPLNIAGGERRLNVAVTRARRRMTVVSALVAEDLDPTRLNARGAQLLREFLAYAASGGVVSERPSAAAGSVDSGAVTTGGDQSSALIAELADRLREQHLVVHEGLGSSADRLELAVERVGAPGELAVAIETDGFGADGIGDDLTARDRDRLRPEQLRRLGWTTMRIWSTDIFRDPARDVERIRLAAGGPPPLANTDDD